jgi:uncharacterized protein (TIGR03435 family)
MSSGMFNVLATVPVGASKEDFKLMLQALLADRFQLKCHWVEKAGDLYDLSMANTRCEVQTIARRSR